MKYVMIVLMVFLTVVSCKEDDTNQTYETVFNVSPTIEYVAPGPPAPPDSSEDIPVMRITEKNSGQSYTLDLGAIEGFTFEEGFRHVISVEVTKLANPPADGPSKTYRLLRIISKE
ncbi:MAG: DUF4377 domain-containing protein [Chryseobacterium sp.]|uniref:DUF4377 domain-containing protein n=1 Tax=Chryseobacterium sp. TaxID=1871047 RepID=UPI0025BC17EC|nr:DUF4377 domain-containing protein [Chryseobacterium sp.]MCJ7935746.1 DUF4377 domain-containing protein [Chryseobacterium sp.]